jgi:hypothetical protein
MSIFANVYTGANPNDGTGDSLRVAFQKIDQNFANVILANVAYPVTSVANRKGDVLLTVTDIYGAVNWANLRTATDAANVRTDHQLDTLNSSLLGLINAANVYSQSYTNTKFANLLSIAGNLSTFSANIGNLYTNAATQTNQLNNIQAQIDVQGYNIVLTEHDVSDIKANIDALKANLGVAYNTVSAANTVTASLLNSTVSTINSTINTRSDLANASIITANIGMKSYVGSATGALWANAGVQSTDIAGLTANAGAQAASLISLLGNASTQETRINELRANITAANATTATGNVGMGNFVTDLTSALRANIVAANAAIVTANSFNQTYTTNAISAAINNLINSAPGTLDTLGEIAANLAAGAGAIGGILNSITNTNANVTAANAAIVTANSAVVSYVNSQVGSLTANNTTQSNQITLVNANLTAANAVIASLISTASVQELSITGLRANITAANGAIVTANTRMKSYVDSNINTINANLGNLYVSTTAGVSQIGSDIASLNANVTAANAAIAGANAAIVTANTAMRNYVSNINSLMVANITAANTSISTLSSAITNLNSQATAFTANLTTGPIAITGNITGANLIVSGTAGGITFADGSKLTSATTAANTGNILISAYTISTVNDTGGNFGITLNPSNGGEIHLSKFTGVNNINPGYWLEIGNLNDNFNTGNLAINFSNGAGFANTATFSYDWWDGNGHGYTNNSSAKHATFGLYRGDGEPASGTTRAFITFDTASAASVAPIQVNANGSISHSTILAANYLFANGVNILSTVSGGAGTYSNTNVSAYLTSQSITPYSNANVASYLPTNTSDIAGGNLAIGAYATSLHNIKGNLLLGQGNVRESADSILTINLNTDTPIRSNATIHVSGAVGKSTFMTLDSFGNNVNSTYTIRKARGTPATPTAIQSGDAIGSYAAKGYGATGFTTSNINTTTGMSIFSAENYTDSAQGTFIEINAIPLGSNIAATAMRLYGTSNVTIAGNVTAPNYLWANGVNIISSISNVLGNLTVAGNLAQQGAYYETYGNVYNIGGNLTCNFNLGTTFYASLSANVTANFSNVNALTGVVTGATIIVDQGATPYRVANVQVNGVNQTVKWVSATAGAGTASNTDVMSFSLIHLGGGVYRVLGQISNYG